MGRHDSCLPPWASRKKGLHRCPLFARPTEAGGLLRFALGDVQKDLFKADFVFVKLEEPHATADQGLRDEGRIGVMTREGHLDAVFDALGPKDLGLALQKTDGVVL